MRKILGWIDTIVSHAVAFGAVLACAFGSPKSLGVLGMAAAMLCLILGIAFLVMVAVAPFIKGPIVSPERKDRFIIFLLIISGVFCIRIGGVWLRAWSA